MKVVRFPIYGEELTGVNHCSTTFFVCVPYLENKMPAKLTVYAFMQPEADIFRNEIIIKKEHFCLITWSNLCTKIGQL